MSNRIKPQFVTSDWHIQHKNVLTYSKRPFRDVDHMAECLIRNFNSIVPHNGVTFFLGDMGMGAGDHIKKVIDQLNGFKVLCVGNHDKGLNGMYNAGFNVVTHGLTTVIGNEIVTMSHCPLLGVERENTDGMKGGEGLNWHGENRPNYNRFYTKNNGQFHLSGHIHSPNNGRSTKTLYRQYDVGVDANSYKPVSFSTIESWIANVKTKENMWKEIEGFPDYKINYYGHIKSFKRYPDGKRVAPYTDKDGYFCNSLRVNDGSKAIKIHRAVAMAFLPNPNNLPQVNHKNGLKFDNSVDNLEWVNNITNQQHAWDNDLKTIKLTTEDVNDIKIRIARGESNLSISGIYDVDPSSISNIRTGKTWERI
jgi:calcineurin-like phosphoesterase family protein